MRWFSVVVACALCVGATGARADDERGIEAQRAEVTRPPPRWGLLVAGGFPEGLAASVVFRPVSEVRLSAGPMWNYIGWGVQAGVTLIPWHMGVSPLLSLEAGRYFSADAAFLAKKSSGVPEEVKPLLTNVAYDYASAHVGIEIGTRDAFAISVRAGLSYVSMIANGTATTYVSTGGTTATVAFTDPHLRGTIPSANVGVQLWF